MDDSEIAIWYQAWWTALHQGEKASLNLCNGKDGEYSFKFVVFVGYINRDMPQKPYDIKSGTYYILILYIHSFVEEFEFCLWFKKQFEGSTCTLKLHLWQR